MAERAVPGLYAGSEQAANMQGKINDDTIIACSAPRKMSVREAEAIYAGCLAWSLPICTDAFRIARLL
jgi:hypothetical protein